MKFVLLLSLSLLFSSCLRWFNAHYVSPPAVPKSITDLHLVGSTWQLDSFLVEEKQYAMAGYLQLAFHQKSHQDFVQYYYSMRIVKDSIQERMLDCSYPLEKLAENDYYIVHPQKQVEYALLPDTTTNISIYFAWWEGKMPGWNGSHQDYKIGLLQEVADLYFDCYFIGEDKQLAWALDAFSVHLDEIFMDTKATIQLEGYKMRVYNKEVQLIFQKI